jgi:hypothetical protein
MNTCNSALPADRADPSLGGRVGVGRLYRCDDDLAAGRAPDIIERPGELGVPVTDQELPCPCLIAEVDDQIPRLLGHPQTGSDGQ